MHTYMDILEHCFTAYCIRAAQALETNSYWNRYKSEETKKKNLSEKERRVNTTKTGCLYAYVCDVGCRQCVCAADSIKHYKT